MRKEIQSFSKQIKSLLLAALFLIGFTACEEVKEAAKLSPEEEAEAAESQAEMSMNFEDVSVIVAEAMQKAFEGTAGGRSLADYHRISCATFTHDATKNTITLDFGDACAGESGRDRKGKINITYTDRILIPGAIIIATLEDFYVDGIKVEGTKTVTNIKEETDEYPVFEVILEDGKVTWPDGKFATRNVNHTRTWIHNANPRTDELHIEGTADGIRKDGKDYSITITDASPVVYKVSCFLDKGIYIPVKGVQWIKSPEKPDVVLNYGEGECDKTITITVNSISTDIEV